MSHTLCFTILDDLRPAYGPIYLPVEKTYKSISAAVKSIISGIEDDPSYYFKNSANNALTINEITSELLTDDYYVWNRFEKYYVIAFALDYTRFEVFSKDCDKELISWAQDGPIKGIIDNSDYNENPVITLFKNLGFQ